VILPQRVAPRKSLFSRLLSIGRRQSKRPIVDPPRRFLPKQTSRAVRQLGRIDLTAVERAQIIAGVTTIGRVLVEGLVTTESRRIALYMEKARVTEIPLIKLAITGDLTIVAAPIGPPATNWAKKRSFAT
jgi:hypothetical protein